TGRPGRAYWQLWTDYAISASFDPATGRVTGREHVVVHNTSPGPMTSMVLRLDQNIFRPEAPRAEAVPSNTDGMQLTALAINGAPLDLAATTRGRGITPLADAIKETSARIPLAAPVPAGGSVALDIDWNFIVPRVVSPERGLRMGAWGDTLYQVAQWYPRVAVFDDLRQGGWDTDPYLGTSEFYNNFGHFDLKLDLPAGWIVGATGVLQNPQDVLTATERERLSHVLDSDSTIRIVGPGEFGAGRATAAGDRLTWHFVADTAGDVAWATSNQFVWDATRATIPGRGAVPVNILYLPGHMQQYAQGGPIARHALEFYSKLWMPYAFPVLTMVDGPENGMEYPMFIMSGAGASDHETGHQWWPMMVGTNETWYGFMDEGFNQYMNILSRDDRAQRPPMLDGLGQSYGRISGNEQEAPLMWDANYGGPMYSFQAYGKAPEMLSMLGGIVGDTAVWRAMSEYARAWRFKHPSPWDYAFFMDNALHRDLGWFWYYWLFTTESVDGSIQDVKASGARTLVTVRQDGEMPSPVVLKVTFAPTGPRIRPMANARMVDSVTAIVTYPVDVWFSGSRTYTAMLDFGGRKIETITLDPARRFPDRDVDDNVWPRRAGQGDGAARIGAVPSRASGASIASTRARLPGGS
ncbi:MAG TPA: M1 family metallopeptidase, partial [Gemmatimonadaceae bacterium]|nr:M1 family metallopeptidase [Gemmatimonadaceae bacterium]